VERGRSAREEELDGAVCDGDVALSVHHVLLLISLCVGCGMGRLFGQLVCVQKYFPGNPKTLPAFPLILYLGPFFDSLISGGNVLNLHVLSIFSPKSQQCLESKN
jgi:hypothetical protein